MVLLYISGMLTVEAERAARLQTLINYYKIVSPVQERGKSSSSCVRREASFANYCSQKVFPSKIDVVTWYLYRRVHGMTNTNVLALKIADVVCAQNSFRRKGTKPILQVTVSAQKQLR
jgi:hypothetical protein